MNSVYRVILLRIQKIDTAEYKIFEFLFSRNSQRFCRPNSGRYGFKIINRVKRRHSCFNVGRRTRPWRTHPVCGTRAVPENRSTRSRTCILHCARSGSPHMKFFLYCTTNHYIRTTSHTDNTHYIYI